MRYIGYLAIIFILAIPMSILFPFYPNDFYATSVAAHTGYISQFGERIQGRYEVSFLKPASFYYIFYFAFYPILNNTFYVISLYYYFYFVIWGLVILFSLKSLNKLNLWNFLIGLSLSVNESMMYGVASFMYSLIYLIGSYVILIKLLDKPKIYFAFVLFSMIILHFLHPYSAIMLIFISVYLFLWKKKIYKDGKKFLFYLMLISALLIVIEAGISLFLSYGKSLVTKYYIEFLFKDPLGFIYHTFIERKIAHFFFQMSKAFKLYLPILSYFIVFCKFKKRNIGLAVLIFFVMLLVPESFPTTQSFGWRFMPIMLTLLLFNIKETDTEFTKYLSILIFLSSLLVLYMFFNKEEYLPSPLSFTDFEGQLFDSTYTIFKFLRSNGYKDIVIIGDAYELYPYYMIEMMDKENFTYAYGYTFSSHPVSPKRGISAIDEVKFIELFKNNFEYKPLDYFSKRWYIKELCKNYEVFIVISYEFNKSKSSGDIKDVEQINDFYKCHQHI